ncbi:ABC transporter permease [Chloroflexota bacterium]
MYWQKLRNRIARYQFELTGYMAQDVIGWLLRGLFVILAVYFIVIQFTPLFTRSATQIQNPDRPHRIITEIRYQLPEAGEVFLVWGLDGWNVAPNETRPAGTQVKDGVMHTPMQRQGDTFVTKVQVPVEGTIDFGFLIAKTCSGATIHVWQANGDQDYHTTVTEDTIIEVSSTVVLPQDQIVGCIADKSLVSQEIHYNLPEAGKVFLVWGINDEWETVPVAIQLEGTIVKNGLMYTPMARKEDSFIARIQAPAGANINYFFEIAKSRSGAALAVWDAQKDTGENHYTIAEEESVIEIEAPPSVGRAIIARDFTAADFGVNLLWLGLLLGGVCAILAAITVGLRVVRPDSLIYWRKLRLKFASRDALKLAVVIIAISVIGFLTVGNYGLSTDEPAGFWGPWQYFDLIVEGKISEGDWIYYGPVFDGTSELVFQTTEYFRNMALNQAQDTDTHYYLSRMRVKHLLTFLTALLAYISVAVITGIMCGWQYAWVAPIVLALFPRFWGHSFFNFKDIPFATLFIFSTCTGAYLVAEYIKKDNKLRIGANRITVATILYGILVGLLTGIRVGGLVVIVFVLIAYIVVKLAKSGIYHFANPGRIQLFNLGALYILMGGAWLVTTILVHPASWSNPVGWLSKAVSYHSAHAWPRDVLFNGQSISAQDLPWYYLPEWIIVTVPVVFQVAFVLGLVLWVVNFRKFSDIQRAVVTLVLLQIFFLPIVAIIKNSTIYDGLRQFLFILPGIAIIATVSLVWLFKWLSGINARLVFAAIVLVLFAQIASDMVGLHPYEYTYFNRISGGLKKVHNRYETDYWGLSLREAMEWVNKNNVSNEKVVVGGPVDSAKTVANPGLTVINLDENLRDKMEIVKPYYYLAIPKFGFHELFPDCKVVYQVIRQATPLAIIKHCSDDQAETGPGDVLQNNDLSPSTIDQTLTDTSKAVLLWLSLLLLIVSIVIWRRRDILPQELWQRYNFKNLNIPAGMQETGALPVLKTRPGRQFLVNSGFLLLVILLTVLITLTYVSSEQTFYYWDYAAYHDMSLAKAINFREIPKNSLQAITDTLSDIRASTAQDYSDFHTLLIVPFILTFGASRLVYILGLSLVYLLPFILITGAIATKLISHYPRTFVFWSAAFLALLVPVVWLPSLRGYPDTSSATLIALAILIYLQDLRLKRWWQIGLIGLCIALAILFRRHFIYDGITFFIVITLQALIFFATQVQDHPRKAWLDLIGSGVRIGLTATFTLIALAIIGWPFIERILNTNFGELYASYEVSSYRNLQYYTAYYGWIAFALAGLGLAIGYRTRVLDRPVAIFIALFAGVSLLQWAFVVKQLGIHYTLHFTLGIVLGLVAFGWTAWILLRGKIRIFVMVASGAYLAFNIVLGLVPTDILNNVPLSPNSFAFRGLFAANNPPLKSGDRDEITRLINYLQSFASSKEPVYVAASSGILSSDHLWHAERELYEQVLSSSYSEFWQTKKLNIIQWTPFADSRDPYPLEKLLRSHYVVVATPVQYHLRPEEQDVVKLVVDAFTENWEFAQDFTRLPMEFSLSNGAVVNIYKRLRPTSQKIALLTLKRMEEAIDTRPGGQSDWVSLTETPVYVIENPNNSYNFTLDLKTSNGSLLYLDFLPAQTMIDGELTYYDEQCNSDVSLQVTTVDASGQMINTKKLAQYPDNDLEFSLSIPTQGAAHLLLDISVIDKNNVEDSCWLILSNFSLFDDETELMTYTSNYAGDQSSAVAQVIRYRVSNANQVFLVWGVNGWQLVPEEVRPDGTQTKDNLLYTKMNREGDYFSTEIQVPPGTTINYVFQIIKPNNNAEIWDTNEGKDYRITASQSGVIEIGDTPTLSLVQSVITNSEENFPLIVSLSLIVVGMAAVLVTRRKSISIPTNLRYLFDISRIIYLRDLLHELVSRDMKLRYKRSALGIFWSLLNPLAQLLVFIFVFSVVLPLNIPNYPLFVFTGLLVWTWFQSALFQSTDSIVANPDLVRRPGFPMPVLPVVTITTHLIHFLLAIPILMVFLLWSQGPITSALLFLPVLIVLQFLLTLSLSYTTAALQVNYRDVQYLLGIILTLTFFMTPIFYDASAIPENYQWLYNLNPIAQLVTAYRAIFLYGEIPDLLPLVIIGIASTALLFVSYKVFIRTSYRFVEEL